MSAPDPEDRRVFAARQRPENGPIRPCRTLANWGASWGANGHQNILMMSGWCLAGSAGWDALGWVVWGLWRARRAARMASDSEFLGFPACRHAVIAHGAMALASGIGRAKAGVACP